MWPPGIARVRSRSRVVRVSRQGRPSASVTSRSSTGSASTDRSEARTARSRRARHASALSVGDGPGPADRRRSARARRTRPARARRSSGRSASGSRPRTAADRAPRRAGPRCTRWSSCAYDSFTCRVPPKPDAAGTAWSCSAGSLRSSRFTFTWAPTGFGPGHAPGQSCSSTHGATPASTRSPCAVRSSPRWVYATRPAGSIAVTSAPVTMRVPAARAARSSAPATVPIPPTGTSQRPVPLPITW